MSVVTRERPLCEQDEEATHPTRKHASVLRAVYAEINPPEGYRVEIVEGQITVSPTPAPRHAFIVGLIRSAVEAVLPSEYGAYENVSCQEPEIDCYIPDLGVWPRELMRSEKWALPGEQCRLALEVTSPGQAKRDYAKAAGYARSGIPVYLLVDRGRQVCVVHSEPHGGEYREKHEVPFGKPVTLPLDPPITLETADF